MSLQAAICARRGSITLDVSLQWAGKGVISLYGPSGCGKTSLLRALAGLDRYPGAQVRFRSEVWQDGASFVAPHARRLGFVFQDPHLFPHLDVLENVRYASRRNGNQGIDDVMELLGLTALQHRAVETLSGGEARRVAIARALAARPRLLLLDEPMSGLDRERRAELMRYLERLHSELDIPIVHVGHSLRELARLADRVALMDEGRILADGPVGEILSDLSREPAHDGRATSIFDARVRTRDSSYGLCHLEFRSGTFIVPSAALAEGDHVRVRVEARDVSIALKTPSDSSILNIFPANVEALEAHGPAMMLVRLNLSGEPLLARITRKSADQLGLVPGMSVVAQVKSVALT